MASLSEPDNKSKPALASLIVSSLIAVLILYVVKPNDNVAFDQAAAVGADTKDYYATNGEYPVHCSDANDVDQCIAGVHSRAKDRTVIWLGNSQLHAINQLKAGEVSSAERLHLSMQVHNWDLTTLSQPNANLQEHYVLFEHMRLHLDVTAVVLSVVFDDTREDGLRGSVQTLIDQQSLKSNLMKSAIGQRLVQSLDQNQSSAIEPERQSWQERSEAALNRRMDQFIPLWANRAELRSNTLFGLYRLRNTVFGISATTKRKVLPGPYANNLAALSALLNSAQSAGIDVLVYIAPIRQDIGLPYDLEQYAQFIQSVERTALNNSARFVNLEQLIDSADWGATSSIVAGGADDADVDFMHFKAAGHETLANKLLAIFDDWILGVDRQ